MKTFIRSEFLRTLVATLLLIALQWSTAYGYSSRYRADLRSLHNTNSRQDTWIRNLEQNMGAMLRRLNNKNHQQDATTRNLERDINAKLGSLDKRVKNIEAQLDAMPGSGSKLYPGHSCEDILAVSKSSSKSAVSKIYWIKPIDSKQHAFQVYCDMETHGGGWTLVYSYTFTKYNSFRKKGNAVTPRPSWPASWANVPISSVPPLSESSLGAVDWNLWKNIGTEFMIKSNINDWIACKPNGGSIVRKKSGSTSCQNIKSVATACSSVAPRRIHWWASGPSLHGSWLYYFFDGSTVNDWPTHDPCGKYRTNHKTGVSNPGGQIYLR